MHSAAKVKLNLFLQIVNINLILIMIMEIANSFDYGYKLNETQFIANVNYVIKQQKCTLIMEFRANFITLLQDI